ncbi:MAG: CoA transferase [Alphaproteobacteria bacterium]|nr:CoA transferase [Alphaproteobacteria bacterium]
MPQAAEILRGLWQPLGLPDQDLARVAFTGAEPALVSSFRVDVAAQVTIAAVAAAAAHYWRLQGNPAQAIGVDLAAAAAEFLSERLYRLDGKPAPDLWDDLAGAYRTKDGGSIRLHTNLPHHRAGLLRLLRAAPRRPAVAEAIASWPAERLEEEGTARGLVLAMARDFAGWDRLPQAAILAAEPLVAVTPLADAPRRRGPGGPRPLSGLRVLDLTRIIAGPVCGRALAAHGAVVLRLIAPGLPTMPALDVDSGRGKYSAHLDLKQADGRERLRELIRRADVLLQSYRPGALAALGFGAEDVARLNPGIVHASLSAYGEEGPWGGKRGFDSLVQTASGFNLAEAEAAGEAGLRPLPCQALDHASGYLLALGTLAALGRQRDMGGGWRVRVSLARSGLWLRGLGRRALVGGLPPPVPEREASASGYGRLEAVRHAARLSLTPARWALPAMPHGCHAAAWPAAG